MHGLCYYFADSRRRRQQALARSVPVHTSPPAEPRIQLTRRVTSDQSSFVDSQPKRKRKASFDKNKDIVEGSKSNRRSTAAGGDNEDTHKMYSEDDLKMLSGYL